MPTLKSKSLAAAMLLAIAAAANAGGLSFNVGGVQVNPLNPTQPFQPPPVKIGSVSVIPPTPSIVPSPPKVHVEGNGEIAKGINRANDIAQEPQKIAQRAVDEAAKGFTALARIAEEGITWPFKAVGKFFDDLVNKAKNMFEHFKAEVLAFLPIVLMWAGVAFFVIVTLAVMCGSFIVGCALRRREPHLQSRV